MNYSYVKIDLNLGDLRITAVVLMEEDTPIGMREIQLHSDYTMDIEIERNALTLDAVNYIYEEALRLHQKDNGVLN